MDLLLSQLYWKVILFFSLIKLLLNYVTPTPTNHFVIYQLWLSLTKLFILFLKEKLNLHVTDILAWLHRRFGWFRGNSAQPELINVQPKFNSTRALI